MKKLILTAIALSLLTVSSQAMASEKKADVTKKPVKEKSVNFENYRPKPPMANLEDELNLTEEQKAKAKANRIKARKEMKPIMTEIQNKKDEVLDVMDSDLSKEEQQAKIKVLQGEIRELYRKANTIREKNMEEFESILTKEQKTKFEKLKKEHMPQKSCKNCAKKMPPPPMPMKD